MGGFNVSDLLLQVRITHLEEPMISSTLLISFAAASFLFLSAFAVTSLREREYRAAGISLALAVVISGLLLSALGLPAQVRTLVLLGLLAIFLILLVLFLLPVGGIEPGPETPRVQVDERTIMFARANLEPESSDFEDYYQAHPEHFKADQRTRRKPGLLSPGARLTEPFSIAAARGSFYLTEALREAVSSEKAPEKIAASPQELTAYLKSLAVHYGALDVGVTDLKPAQLYSHIGRGSGPYGAPITLEHPFAVAFTVEMDFQNTAAAPHPAQIMESSRQYVESARTAVQLAAAIRALGYDARAHIDGNYRVITPLVARDAGLGEIGRIGLLMTPRQGPRVRLGVVTTSAPLETDPPQPNPALLDFCRICRKCAENCPSQSIPHGERRFDNGVLRWKLDPDTCYRYWTSVGTDCGRCLAVCPYSHPDSWAHNLIRWGIDRSGLFRRAALLLDDLFYGKSPPPKPARFPFPEQSDPAPPQPE